MALISKKRTRVKSESAAGPEQRFLELLHLCKLTDKEFRARYGVDSRHRWNWFNRDQGLIPDTPESWGVIQQAAKDAGVVGLTLDWLNLNAGNKPYLGSSGYQSQSAVKEIRGKVPEGMQRVLCLDGFEPHTHHIDIPSSLLRNNPRLLEPHMRVVENFGEAMRGEIEDGDICFVDTTVTSYKGQAVYACHMKDFPLVQRIKIHGPGVLRIQGTKPTDDSFDVYEENIKDLHIRGRVVFVLSGKDLLR